MISTFNSIRQRQPQFFSSATITVAGGTMQAMAELVAAIESVIALPGYQAHALARAPAIARLPGQAHGVFMGYDFHLTAVGPKLIEINTNSGGGLLNAYLLAEHGKAEQCARIRDEFVAMFREEWVLARGDALNDVVLNSGVSARMIEFDLYIEEQFVYTQRSDGLIISTPTGSTAYSLSGGGPIMHPGLDALVLVPMFPHTLGSRPLVIHGNSSVRIVINAYNDLHPNISCDGQLNFRASPGDVIHIHKKPERLQLLHPLEHNFYAICRAKLGWGSRPDGDE